MEGATAFIGLAAIITVFGLAVAAVMHAGRRFENFDSLINGEKETGDECQFIYDRRSIRNGTRPPPQDANVVAFRQSRAWSAGKSVDGLFEHAESAAGTVDQDRKGQLMDGLIVDNFAGRLLDSVEAS